MSAKTSSDDWKPQLLSTDIDGFEALAELALDLRSSWNHAADPIWKQLDPVLWDVTHNPWAVLQTVSREKLQRSTGRDPAFRNKVDAPGAASTGRRAGAARGIRSRIRTRL